jgi:hypothetical protein
MPELVKAISFLIAFLMVLAAIRQFLLVMGHERFTRPIGDRRITYSVLAFFLAAIAVVVAGAPENMQVSAAVLVSIIALCGFGGARSVYRQYREGVF